MPCPLLVSSQSDYLICIFDRNLHVWRQTVQIQTSSEANWSGSALFAKTGHVVFSKRRVKDMNSSSQKDVFLERRKIPFLYSEYWDSLTPYHTCLKFWTSPFHYLLMCLNYQMSDKQCSPRSDATFSGILSGSAPFVEVCLSVCVCSDWICYRQDSLYSFCQVKMFCQVCSNIRGIPVLYILIKAFCC